MVVGSLENLMSLGIWREITNFPKFSKFSVLRQPHSKAVVLGFGRTIVDGKAKGYPKHATFTIILQFTQKCLPLWAL